MLSPTVGDREILKDDDGAGEEGVERMEDGGETIEADGEEKATDCINTFARSFTKFGTINEQINTTIGIKISNLMFFIMIPRKIKENIAESHAPREPAKIKHVIRKTVSVQSTNLIDLTACANFPKWSRHDSIQKYARARTGESIKISHAAKSFWFPKED